MRPAVDAYARDWRVLLAHVGADMNVGLRDLRAAFTRLENLRDQAFHAACELAAQEVERRAGEPPHMVAFHIRGLSECIRGLGESRP